MATPSSEEDTEFLPEGGKFFGVIVAQIVEFFDDAAGERFFDAGGSL
jgi:hypothetical protein